MAAKRVAVWLLSLSIGALAGYATVVAFGTSLERYAVDLNFGVLDVILNNFTFLCLAYASLVWIWLDFFLGTEMLPE
ncbi:MAG: hypothetical protein QGG60_00835 [Anaerolineales bacterium]|jgi:putative Mn2+ efflux pump MntP|nr:hypothetical protein [Anaerolineales bacterium]MDP7643224.1 hypothetical protein [Anaerolineales bacterium]HJN40920.1 hypothetical protein [Anaerolineales bacterium]|tara:strand:+ start:678 stop:908 length:231 start_codon:yes stop_codon:yes gene_type:complete